MDVSSSSANSRTFSRGVIPASASSECSIALLPCVVEARPARRLERRSVLLRRSPGRCGLRSFRIQIPLRPRAGTRRSDLEAAAARGNAPSSGLRRCKSNPRSHRCLGPSDRSSATSRFNTASYSSTSATDSTGRSAPCSTSFRLKRRASIRSQASHDDAGVQHGPISHSVSLMIPRIWGVSSRTLRFNRRDWPFGLVVSIDPCRCPTWPAPAATWTIGAPVDTKLTHAGAEGVRIDS